MASTYGKDSRLIRSDEDKARLATVIPAGVCLARASKELAIGPIDPYRAGALIATQDFSTVDTSTTILAGLKCVACIRRDIATGTDRCRIGATMWHEQARRLSYH